MPPVPDQPEPRLALVVATGTYTADPGLHRLRAPARDADDLARVLADPGIGGFTVTTVIDQPAQQIRLAIEDFLDGRGTGDLLLVYLSCHGLLDARRRLYFAATDTRKDRLGATGVEAAWVLDQLEHCRARRQVLILDSCFSGAFAYGVKGEADIGLRDRFLGQGRGRVVLTASTATEYSFEGDPTDAVSPAGSVFTAALVQGLRTGAADTDHDGHVSVDDAYAYVFDQVQAAGAAQTPQRWLYGVEGKILLARSPAGPAIIPTPPPESLLAGLDSPHPGIRIGVVTELGEWLTGGDPAQAAIARRHLQEVAETDIPRVADTARTLLGTGTTAEPSAPPERHTRAPAPPHRATPVPVPPSHLARTLTGHTQPLLGVAFSPDGLLLATASMDETARLWDPATFDCLRTLTGHTGWVLGVAFSPDGLLLATASGDRTARLWDPATGDHRRTLTGHADKVLGVAFSPDGLLLATASTDKTARLWDPATGKRQRTLKGHTDHVNDVAFSPDGRLLGTASKDGTARLWDPATGKHLRTLTGQTDAVYSVAFSPDGRLLATGSSDAMARLWDLATGQRLRTLDGHTDAVHDVAFSQDGRLLATGSFDGTARLWDPATFDCLHTLTGHTDHNGVVDGVAFSPDGRLLATGSDDRTARLWN
jgi:Tol biopolymer transport system component